MSFNKTLLKMNCPYVQGMGLATTSGPCPLTFIMLKLVSSSVIIWDCHKLGVSGFSEGRGDLLTCHFYVVKIGTF